MLLKLSIKCSQLEYMLLNLSCKSLNLSSKVFDYNGKYLEQNESVKPRKSRKSVSGGDM